MIKKFVLWYRYLYCRALSFIFTIVLLLLGSSLCFATQHTMSGVYYRYYDAQGRVTISKSVSAAHIQRGYEILDKNMTLLTKIPPYNLEQDLRQEKQRALKAERKKEDQQIKRAYRNVKYATEKKNESLNVLDKKIDLQFSHLRRLQTDRNIYLNQQSNYILQRQSVPENLKRNIEENDLLIKNTRLTIEQLKLVKAEQINKFDYIIERLQHIN